MGLFLHIDHFFDDFWIIEPQATAASAIWAFRSLCKVFGYILDDAKSRLPNVVWDGLGVKFDMIHLRSEGILKVRPKPTRLVNVMTEILQILLRKPKKLFGTQAGKLFGKLDFINQEIFGKVGRVGLLPIKQRQYEFTGEVTFELEAAL